MTPTRTLALIALSLLPLACGESNDSPAGAPGAPTARASAEPADVAEEFLRAVQDQDSKAMAALVTERARAALEGGGFGLNGERLQSFEIGETSVEGREAEVEAVVVEGGERKHNDLLLRRESAGWRVRGLRVQFGDGTFTVDLEQMSETAAELGEQLGESLKETFGQAKETWEQGGTPDEIAAERARFEAITAVTENQHEAAWRVDVVGEGRPIMEVLGELVASSGLEVEGGQHEKALWSPFGLTLQNVSRVEAVERVAAAAGLYPIWPDARPDGWSGATPAPLTFGAGKRPWPATFTGPFLVEVNGVLEDAPNAVGRLSLAVRALGLAPAALAFQGDMAEVLRLERVRSDQEQPLTDEDVRHMGAPEVRDGYFTYSLDKDLVGLLASVESVDAVVGAVRLTLPATVTELSWKRGDATTRTVGDWKLTVAQWSKQTRFDLEGLEGTLEGVDVRLSPRRASGAPLGVLYGGSDGWGSQVQASVQCPETPAAIDLKICTTKVQSYPFTLRHVRLQHAAEQPARLEPLAFAGTAPVLVELTEKRPAEGDQWEVTLRLRNTSNKHAVSLMVEFVYLDAAGKELDGFPHTLTGEYDFDAGRCAPLVAAGKTVVHETHAAFVPPGTAHIRFRLQRAEFPDGTVWEPE